MSMQKNIIHGVYVEYITKTKITKGSVYECPNKHQHGRKHKQYCSACGEKIKGREIDLQRRITIDELIVKESFPLNYDDLQLVYVDNFEDKEWLVSNDANDPDSIDVGELEGAVILDVDSKAAIIRFKEKWKDFLKEFSPYCESLEVKFGVLVFYS